jgi:Kyakuja-Dileera-Zisupton transposase
MTWMKKLPAALHLQPDTVNMQFGLPIWHASAHEVSCQMENSLGLQEGVGWTDGEGIERTWAEMNTMATSTKEMGEGA